jgi:hypothetical protein
LNREDGGGTLPSTVLATIMPTLRLSALFIAVACAMTTSGRAAEPAPIFDAHLHYNDEATSTYPIPDVLRRFADARVGTILATSRPNDGTRALVAAGRADRTGVPRVVPFIRPYRNHADRATWFNDPAIFALIETELARDIEWRGIGEFHVFGRDADTPWVKKIVSLAVSRGLWLHAHCDDAALEILFAHDPRVRIIWAHSGFSTPPSKIAQYLERYPGLVGELSYRYDVTEAGRLTPPWRTLFVAWPDRFLLGSDTWINERWARYGEIFDYYRSWLRELPPDVAAKIASGNGERLFPARAGP